MESWRLFFVYVWCEWIKRRRSLGSWLILVGALFTPTVVLLARIVHHGGLYAIYTSERFWPSLWTSSWESMAVFFAPMGAILVPSLIVQIEHRANAWKHVRTLPLSSFTLYAGKLIVILAMMAQLFVLFDVGVLVSAWIPCVLHLAPWPLYSVPLMAFVKDTARYMIDCLPILTAEYLISLHFKNFLVPVGVGFMTWVAALAALSWRYGYLIPYSYSMMTYLRAAPKSGMLASTAPLELFAVSYAILFSFLGYGMFSMKGVKG
jgi:lantibiotic transport system permease protein